MGLYTIILSLIFAGTFVFILISSFERLFQFVIDLTDAREQVMTEITTQFHMMLCWLAVVTVAYLGLIISLSISCTHKLIGPTIAFRRHIRSLIEERFNSRVTLRKGDAFAEVAEELNTLAALLEEKSKRS